MDDDRLPKARLETFVEESDLATMMDVHHMAVELLRLRETMRAIGSNKRVKITDAQVVEIRRRRADGETLRAIGKAVGCSHGQVRNICLGHSRLYVDIGAGKSDN